MDDEVKPLPNALKERWQNTAGKYTLVEDLLPDLSTIDLTSWKTHLVEAPDRDGTELRRQEIAEQKVLLQQQFSGQPELLFWHTLCISYLRRNTQVTAKANAIFRLMWEQESEFLLANLTPRWVVSALQTFFDHGVNEGERLAGLTGFLYGNLIKIYETERNTMRDKLPHNVLPRTFKNLGVPGLFGFVPGDDILININALVYGVATLGGLASAPLLHLLQVIFNSDTIFSRCDALSEVKKFRNHPSYTLSFEGRLDRRK
jgi:hypothetical protein